MTEKWQQKRTRQKQKVEFRDNTKPNVHQLFRVQRAELDQDCCWHTAPWQPGGRKRKSESESVRVRVRVCVCVCVCVLVNMSQTKTEWLMTCLDFSRVINRINTFTIIVLEWYEDTDRVTIQGCIPWSYFSSFIKDVMCSSSQHGCRQEISHEDNTRKGRGQLTWHRTCRSKREKDFDTPRQNKTVCLTLLWVEEKGRQQPDNRTLPLP